MMMAHGIKMVSQADELQVDEPHEVDQEISGPTDPAESSSERSKRIIDRMSLEDDPSDSPLERTKKIIARSNL